MIVGGIEFEAYLTIWPIKKEPFTIYLHLIQYMYFQVV